MKCLCRGEGEAAGSDTCRRGMLLFSVVQWHCRFEPSWKFFTLPLDLHIFKWTLQNKWSKVILACTSCFLVSCSDGKSPWHCQKRRWRICWENFATSCNFDWQHLLLFVNFSGIQRFLWSSPDQEERGSDDFFQWNFARPTRDCSLWGMSFSVNYLAVSHMSRVCLQWIRKLRQNSVNSCPFCWGRRQGRCVVNRRRLAHRY